MLFIGVFGLVVLVACWWMGDLRWTTKSIFTLIYLASFGLLFTSNYALLFIVVQCGFIAVVGAATFGLDWLMRDVR
jgi:hypothetical protein